MGNPSRLFREVTATTMNPTPEPTQPEVKPCPFCGAWVADLGDGWMMHSATTSCFLSRNTFTIRDWNTRTPEPDLAAEVARLSEALEKAYIRENQAAQSYEEAELSASALRAEVERLKATAAHMEACRAILNVPSDEVLCEAIREKLTALTAAQERERGLRGFPMYRAIFRWLEENWEMNNVQRNCLAEGLSIFLTKALAASDPKNRHPDAK